MNHYELIELFKDNPVISAVSDINELDKALIAASDIVFILTGDIFNLEEAVIKCKENNKVVFLHLDLIKGFSKDAVAIAYIKKHIKVDGVISTKVSLLKAAREEGLFIIQRLFMLDSASYDASVQAIQSLKPDAVEIMPGILPKIITRVCKAVNIPVIAGGLIDKKEEIITGLKAGATCISTTKQNLWNE
ncbi:glycerol-3-phosphate responsive antiterminator [Anaeromicropila populeti]|uniref:Glycerol uptake operon antiterminator n=1 Tax=Anaeromicropila populeti TaxID=37658 RepID=A0A1I6I6R0_9FIRM|nr:glycerol-3-phosphate responsive antiterminator [Anaeromicropila populeti]SFR62318.1 glycerol uptake operon antiterminator [Anaeromicropila populeti]